MQRHKERKQEGEKGGESIHKRTEFAVEVRGDGQENKGGKLGEMEKKN